MRVLCVVLSIFSVLVWTALPARGAGDAGAEAFHRGDFDAAVTAWRQSAEAGHAEAQWGLGRLLLLGGDTDGVTWIKRSASAGHLPAALRMAHHHLFGLYTPQDIPACVAWLQRIDAMALAAHRAHPAESASSQLLLSSWYKLGVGGLTKDMGRWETLLRRSADAGDPEAQFSLAEALLNGQGLPRDVPRAYLYYILSWKQEWKGAREAALALRKKLSTKQLTEAQALARDWLARKDTGTLGWAFEADKRGSEGQRRAHEVEEMLLDVYARVSDLDLLRDMPCRPLAPSAAKVCPARWLRSRERIQVSKAARVIIERWTMDNGRGTRSYRVVLRPGEGIGGRESSRWEVRPEGKRPVRGRS